MCVFDSYAVKHAFRPARSGEDVVDAAADVAVEFLEVGRCDTCGLDEVVEFEDEFVFGVKSAVAYYGAEVTDGGFTAFHVEREGDTARGGGKDVFEFGLHGH